ncbi:DMT family transporter [Aurantimonas sp. Leaf443]|uniref:DMT family transporter n=1 Tax=Aurantimonas sp. Leaf443 TaxID=1736378 RepID=UPI0006FD5CAC|nr:DMT family transporter [Aurantimonas sp. Leaf443]KQT88429.1 hypothetical protein ASG48_03165 [Aurantimonas sp. Leaf443]
MASLPSTAADADAGAVYARGLGFVTMGGLLLSLDIPMIRLSDSSFWSAVLIRSSLAVLAVLALWAFERRGGKAPPLVAGRAGLLVTGLYTCSSLGFVTAIFTTDAANVVFILALNPLFAAILSFLLIGERPSLATVLAVPVTLLGIALIIGSGLESGNWMGDLAALATALCIALALTLTRRSGRDMRYASALGMLPCALLAAPFAFAEGLHSESVGWLVANGGLVLPISLVCLSIAPSFVPAPVVSMGYLLETVLAPLWVWMVFDEVPRTMALVGGAVVIAALVGHSAMELAQRRRPKQAPAA